LPATIHDYPDDVSPYGVRGLGGNIRDWCCSAFEADDSDLVDGGRAEVVQATTGSREIRGGSWLSAPRLVRSALRFGGSPKLRKETVGFRLARSIDP
jgi:serine/threonine-protein kinase